MAVKKYKGAKDKADVIFSKVVRLLGYCEADGWRGQACKPPLQCAHIVSRRFNATRTDTRNAFCLCASHHRLFTDYPKDFSRFITDSWAHEHYDTLFSNSRDTSRAKKIDWMERVEFLKKIHEGEITIEHARSIEDD